MVFFSQQIKLLHQFVLHRDSKTNQFTHTLLLITTITLQLNLIDNNLFSSYYEVMEKLFSIKQAQEIDLATQKDYLVDPLVLMEQAGLKCYLKLKEFKDLSKEKTLFIGGGGNNGGDILVMAREAYLEGYKDISVVVVAS